MSDELFNELAPWASKAADHWCCRRGIDARLRGDCVQEALIACWLATKRFDAGCGNAKAFCMCRMIGGIRDFLRREAPKGFRNRAKKNWRGVVVMQTSNISRIQNTTSGEWIDVASEIPDGRREVVLRDAEIREVFDAIESKLEGRNLLVWVCLRNGMTQPEIAQRLRLSETRVYQLVNGLRKRFGPSGKLK